MIIETQFLLISPLVVINWCILIRWWLSLCGVCPKNELIGEYKEIENDEPNIEDSHFNWYTKKADCVYHTATSECIDPGEWAYVIKYAKYKLESPSYSILDQVKSLNSWLNLRWEGSSIDEAKDNQNHQDDDIVH